MIYIVGSGPAGVSAAVALTAGGHAVTMLDAGLDLEAERREILSRMSSLEPSAWARDDVAAVKENMQSGASGIPLKYIYGSDFPYRGADEYLPREAHNVGLLPSFGRGGLGNVWGAAVLPYLDSELAGWPIRYEDLAPHYASVFRFMPLAARKDDLAVRFPLHSDIYHVLPSSRQAQALLSDMDFSREKLHSRGMLFGASRLAVASPNEAGRACAACGLCMYGCPYELIYNPAATLRELVRHPNFSYRPGVVVEHFAESAGQVQIKARSLAGDEQLTLTGSRLYLAAGVLPTAKLVLESMQAYDQVLTIKDSQYFLLPFLRYEGVAGAGDESLHTLSQAFVEVFDRSLSEHSIHLQVYTYNELYRQALQAMFRGVYPLVRPGTDLIMNRLLVIQGYLHSDLSGNIAIELSPAGAGGPRKLRLTGTPGRSTRRVLKGLVAKLRGSRNLLRGVPLGLGMKVGEPGRGFHSGGTLPMRDDPGPFETDTLGRLHGFNRVHVVDSSVFPSINASTITLTVMANAHRIGAAHV